MSDINLLREIIGLKILKKKGFGEKSLFDLLTEFKGSGYKSLISFIREQSGRWGFTGDEIEPILSRSEEVRKLTSFCEDMGIKVITACDEDFPSALVKLRLLPVIFYKGDISLLNESNIAVVGTRNPTAYGIEMTERLVKIISRNSNVVSGGALGIDTVAHSSALKFNCRTIVFLGTSIDKPYPAVNIPLFDRIVDSGGLIISAYGPFEETNEYTFARRNQYIAEISKAVIVIEGGEKSGAGLTAEYAFRKSIEVFALPGPVTSDKSFCPNLLISKGAKIIYSEKVISDFLGLTDFGKNQRDDNSVYNEISDDETSILKIISDIREAHIDEILVKSGRGAGEVNELLLSMELKGIIEQLPGKIYRKRSY